MKSKKGVNVHFFHLLDI